MNMTYQSSWHSQWRCHPMYNVSSHISILKSSVQHKQKKTNRCSEIFNILEVIERISFLYSCTAGMCDSKKYYWRKHWQAQSFAHSSQHASYCTQQSFYNWFTYVKVSIQIKYDNIKLNTQSQTNDPATTHVIIENALPTAHWNKKNLRH